MCVNRGTVPAAEIKAWGLFIDSLPHDSAIRRFMEPLYEVVEAGGSFCVGAFPAGDGGGLPSLLQALLGNQGHGPGGGNVDAGEIGESIERALGGLTAQPFEPPPGIYSPELPPGELGKKDD